MLPVVHVGSRFIHRFVAAVVGGGEHLRGKFVLSATVSVHFGGSDVLGVLQASLSGPVGLGAERDLICGAVKVGVGTSTEDI